MLQRALVLSLTLCLGLCSSISPAAAAECPAFDGVTLAGMNSHPAGAHGSLRCGTLDQELRHLLLGVAGLPEGGGLPTDCSAVATNPTPDYDTDFVFYIPVVFHVLAPTDVGNPGCAHNPGATGHVSDALLRSQIDILNEDFEAILGTPGGQGYDAGVRFFLATVDPAGNPTTGINRHCNSTWYNDNGSYWNTIAWDPLRYLNIYTNNAGGSLGYVPFLPADGGGVFVGTASDRVVLLWDSVGRNAPGGAPYDQGRTGTHEVGHYLGLEHTFNGGCAAGASPGCYANGDLICDTAPEASPNFFVCPPNTRDSCAAQVGNDPIDNYMDYSDDLCMFRFTDEQSHRMRCSLTHYRDELPAIFVDGFESGDTTGGWSP